ncbi:glycosyltransferase family 4 protein [Aggregatilineales bacterium SYSU G02658]
MHIALLSDRIPPENRGGAGEIVWRLAQGLQRAGHAVTIIAATDGPPFDELREGIPTYHLHSRYPDRWQAYLSLYNPQTIAPLRRLLTNLKPDVVHAHNIHRDLSYHSLALARQLGIRTVFTSHDVMPFAYGKISYFVQPHTCALPPQGYRLPPFYNLRKNRLRYNPVRNLWIRRVLAQCDARIAVSHALARAHAENGLSHFSVVHNGIDVVSWRVDAADITALQAQLQIEGRQVILFGGRMTNAKGTQQLLQALARVFPRVPRALLLVAGTQPIEEQVPPALLDPVRDFVRSAGWLAGRALAAAYRMARLVVTPSVIFDSFPTMNLEAMACGVPVVTTCFGGAQEAVIDGQTGFVVNPFNIDALAEAIERLLTDDALAARMGAAGLARAQQHFSIEEFVRLMLQHY